MSPAKPVVVTPLVPSGVTVSTVRRWVNAARRVLPLGPQIISVVFVGPTTSQQLNSRYRRRRRPTNVLSFSFEPLAGRRSESTGGEIVLCPSVIRREARQQHQAYRPYLRYLINHGLIHLLGLDHRTPSEQRHWKKFESRLSLL